MWGVGGSISRSRLASRVGEDIGRRVVISKRERRDWLDILVKLDSSVGELAEGASLLDLGGGLSVLYSEKHQCQPSCSF